MTGFDENDWLESELEKVVGFGYNFQRIINDLTIQNDTSQTFQI
jgi:hypothetical protein